jgi:hypothetical protein
MTSPKEARDLIRLAQKAGWEYLGLSGGQHHRIRWPKTGQVLTVPSSPSFPLMNSEADIARISGPLRPKPGTGRPKAERAAARRRKAAARVHVAPVGARTSKPGWRDQLAAVKTSLEQHQEAA